MKTYFGAEYTWNKIDTGVQNISSNLDEKDNGYSIFFGIEANKNLDVELSYNKFGQATLSGVSGNQFKIDGTTYQFNQTATITAKADSYGIALKPKAELAPGFEAFATLGYHKWDSEVNYAGTTVSGSYGSEDGYDIFYGVGLKYTSGNLSAALTYTEYELDDKIKSTGIRAAYRF
jgi:predicted porin